MPNDLDGARTATNGHQRARFAFGLKGKNAICNSLGRNTNRLGKFDQGGGTREVLQ
jgi:hypothetical protein